MFTEVTNVTKVHSSLLTSKVPHLGFKALREDIYQFKELFIHESFE